MRSLHPWPIFPSNLDPPVARSLSLQFILQELIVSFELLQELRDTTPEQLQGANLKEEVASVSKELERFLLFALRNPFSQTSSVLDKLCFYCEILLQASREDNLEIQLVLETMRTPILKMRSKMTAWQKMLAPLDQILEQLLDLYTDLHQKFCHLFNTLSPFLKEARSDENVLIYLIEQKNKLNAFLGERHVEKLLESFFPAGHSQLRAAIHEGYMRRGFSGFFAKVEPLINEIEWETSCPSPMIY